MRRTDDQDHAGKGTMAEGNQDKAPSRVKLTLFSLYRNGRDGVQPIVGASGARLLDDGCVELVAASVPFNDDRFAGLAPAAGVGLVALFGIRDAIDELHHWRTVARGSGAGFAWAEAWIDVGEIDTRMTTRQALEDAGRRSRFVNLRRTTAEVQRDVLAEFRRYVREAGDDADATMAEVRHLASRPDLFGRLLAEWPPMRGVDVLVVPVADAPDGSGRMRQVAWLRAGARIVDYAQGSDRAVLRLPGWLDGAAAGRSRGDAAVPSVASDAH